MFDVANITISVDSANAIASLRGLNGAVDQFDRQLNRTDGTLRNFEKGLGSMRRAVLGMQAALGGFGLSQMIRELIHTNTQFERVRYALLAGSDSAAAAAADFQWIRQEAVKLGAPLDKVGLEYAKLAAAAKDTALQGQPVRNIFSSVGKAAQAMGLEVATTQRIFMALSQMLSKGRVQAEEARQQFGEHLPGGFKALAKAAGFDAVKGLGQFSKALEQGKVDAIDMLSELPKVLDEMFGGAFEAALVSSPALAIGRFKALISNLLYDLGQNGGFMREFVGMLRDMEALLSSSKGAQIIQDLSDALGQLMAMTRKAVGFVVTNIETIFSAFAGLTAGSLIVGLRGFVAWMGRLAGQTTLVGALRNPWILLATAIGTATSYLISFGRDLLTIGGYTAKVNNWLSEGFKLAGVEVEKLGKKIGDMIGEIPVIGAIFKGLVAAVEHFQISMSNGWGISESLITSVKRFKQAFENSVDPKTLANIKSFLDNVMSFGGKVRDSLLTLQPLFVQIVGAIKATFGTLWENIGAGAKTLLDTISPILAKIPLFLNSLTNSSTFSSFVGLFAKSISFVSNLALGLVTTFGAAFRLILELWAAMTEALMPVIEPALDAIGRTIGWVIDRLKTMFDMAPDSTGWDVLARSIGFVYDVVAVTVTAIAGLVSLVAGIAGPIIDALSMAVRGVVNVIESVISAFVEQAFRGGATAQAALGAAASNSQNEWVKSGDIIVGAILTVIRTLGVMISVVGNVVASIIQLGSRASSVFQGLSLSFNGFFQKDAAAMAKGGEMMGKALADPMRDYASEAMDDISQYFSDVTSGKDFKAVSNAVTTVGKVGGAFSRAKSDIGKGFAQVSTSAITDNAGATNNTAYAAGQTVASSYLQGLMDQWGKNASAATAADEAAKKRLAQSQSELAAQQASAWQDQNAAVDRNARPNPMSSGGAGSKGGKSSAQRANDQLQDLIPQMRMADQLIKQIQAQEVSYQDLNAVMDAQNALKRANFSLSYDEAVAQGGLAGKLAKTAYQASLLTQRLQQLEGAQKEIAKNQQTVAAFGEQANLARDLTRSSSDYRAELAAQQALRQHFPSMTYAEAKAVDALGNALHPVEKKLAESAEAAWRFKEAATAVESTASELRNLKQLGNEFEHLAAAAGAGATPLAVMGAELDAQHAVMQQFKDEIFDTNRLLDPNVQLLYDQARAFSLAGNSADSYARMLTDINDAYRQMRDPIKAAREDIMEESSVRQRALGAGLEIARNRFNEQKAAAGSDPARATENIARATAEWKAAQARFDQSTMELQATTEDLLMRKSNNIVDAIRVSFADIGLEAQNVGEEMQNIFADAFSGMADVLTNFVMTGKLSFRELAQSIIQDITRMIVKWLAWQAIKSAANFLLPGSGTVMSMFGFAEGGVMTSGGAMPLQKYAKGGIANSPQLALFGEGSGSEAFVPLPDGRTIPVTLTGAGGASGGDYAGMSQSIALGVSSGISGALGSLMSSSGGLVANAMTAQSTAMQRQGYMEQGSTSSSAPTVVIEANVTVQGGGGGQGGGAGMDERSANLIAQKIGAEIRTQVIETVQAEMRPGGVFNRMGSNRSRF